MLSPELLNILACPTCKCNLIYLKQPDKLLCNNCLKTYPVEGSIPILMEERSEPYRC